MRAPVLAPIHAIPAPARRALPPLAEAPAVSHFVVVRDGASPHGQWGSGEVLVCRGEAAEGDTVVLVARGHGRPMLGSVGHGGRLYGDAGEPCHPERWRVAGRLVATWRARREGWVCALADADGNVGSVPMASASAAVPAQLDLFGVAA